MPNYYLQESLHIKYFMNKSKQHHLQWHEKGKSDSKKCLIKVRNVELFGLTVVLLYSLPARINKALVTEGKEPTRTQNSQLFKNTIFKWILKGQWFMMIPRIFRIELLGQEPHRSFSLCHEWQKNPALASFHQNIPSLVLQQLLPASIVS